MSEKRCIYCQKEITEPSKEHIIPNAFGSTKKSQRIVCKECNGQMGHDFEAEFCNQFNALRVLFGVFSGDGKEAPPLRKLKTEDGVEYDLYHGGIPKLSNPEFVKTQLSDSKSHINAKYRSWKEAKKHFRGFLKKGVKEIEVEFIREYLNSYLPINMGFGGEESFREISKIAFNYFATTFGSDLALNSEFDEIRNYIRYGKKPNSRRAYLDFFPIPHPAPELGMIDHSVAIFSSDKSPAIWGVVRLYGAISFMCVLADTNLLDREWGKIFVWDPLNREYLELDFTPIYIPDTPVGTEAVYRSRNPNTFKSGECWIHKIAPRLQKHTIERRYDGIIRESLSKALDEPNGRVLTDTDVANLAHEFARRYVDLSFKPTKRWKFSIKDEDDLRRAEEETKED